MNEKAGSPSVYDPEEPNGLSTVIVCPVMAHVAEAATIGAVAVSILHVGSSFIVVGNTTVIREPEAIEFWGFIVILYLVCF
jgi:hypothetical protein